ncbi:transposase [Aliarcobacter butzleri]|uniref:transposase n=1 Tax=Aliarcobacter butzleri TaxID=28197 RepID=UPI0021B64B6A|nr:transposase [Aliarcobacter butzleri]MCT7571306.1 transposase [Aliarcobacter butzleri]
MDATVLKIRVDRVVKNIAAYIMLGITLEGKKEILGIWIGENETSKYWLTGYFGTFGKNATKNFKLTLKSDTLLYEPLELIFPYKDTLSTPKTISSSIS